MHARANVMFGDSFLVEKECDRQQYYHTLSKGSFFRSDKQLEMKHVLSPLEFSRLQGHLENKPLNSNMGGCCITDLEQKDTRTSTSCFIPTLLKHGKLVSLEGGGVLFTPKEHLVIMGEPGPISCSSLMLDLITALISSGLPSTLSPSV